MTQNNIMRCWIDGCPWTEILPEDLVAQMEPFEYDDLHTAHLWSVHTVAEMGAEIDRRTRPLAHRPLDAVETAIVAVLRTTMMAVITNPLPDDPTGTTIPLADTDVDKLAELSFAWDLSPQQTLRRLLDEALAQLAPPPGDDPS